MVKFLGGSCEPKSDDKPRVKEADTVKIPAFPLAETYRNWRIKTREAVVAASADLDNAFRWVSESWKETQTREALWKVAPLATLDAKLLSALANSIAGDFARKVDTNQETEATAGRIVRGRQVLFMLHDHFSIKHQAWCHLCTTGFVQCAVAWRKLEVFHLELRSSVGWYRSNSRRKCFGNFVLSTSQELQGRSTRHE